MRYRLQRHDGTDCSATMVPFTVLRLVPIQRYCQDYRRGLTFERLSRLRAVFQFHCFHVKEHWHSAKKSR